MSEQKKRGFSVKKGGGTPSKSRAYPVQVCSTRYKDPATGKWVPTPKDTPKAGRTYRGRSVDDRAVVARLRDDETGEVTAARVTLPGMRAQQRAGKVRKAAVRDAERELSRDALAAYNPARAQEIELERMHEAHRSAKGTRGAATRAKNKAAGRGKKARPVDTVRLELLRAEQLVKDAQRRHDGAKTYKTRAQYAETLKKRQHKARVLRAELVRVSG